MTTVTKTIGRFPVTPWRLLVGILAVLTAFRLYYIGSVPLIPDEAYYWQWSRYPAFGYFDQGPLVAWVIRAGTALFGDTETGVRFTAVLFGLGTSLLVFDFCRRIFKDDRLGVALVLFYNSTLLFTVGSIIQTYDTPQCFFWMLCLYGAGLAFFEGRRWAWYGAGVAAGLAMLTKYSSVLLPLSIFAFMVFNPGQRHWLKRREPWITALLAAAVYSPNLIWNAGHHWAAFNHTLGHAGGEWKFTTFEFIGGQWALVGPVAFVLLMVGLWRAFRQARSGDDRQAFLLWTSLPVLFLFLAVSFKARVYGNWTGPAYLSAGLAAGLALAPGFNTSPRLKRWGRIALVTGYLIVVPAHFHGPLIKALDMPGNLDPTRDLYGAPEMGQAVGRVLSEWPEKEKPFVFALRYQVAGLTAFYTPGHPRVECLFLPGERLNTYAFWTDPARLKGRDGLAVVYYPLDPKVAPLFEKTKLIRILYLKNSAGKIAHRRALYWCRGFKGYDFRRENGWPGE